MTRRNQELQRLASKRWKARNPEANLAHKALYRAVQNGTVAKPKRCEDCGARHSELHGHHPDYDKPLEVDWLCPRCHAACHYPKEMAA